MGQVGFGIAAVYVTTVAVGALKLAIDTAIETFKKKPTRPRAPPENTNISQDDLKSEAQNKLKLDVSNHYNYALCGPRGTGKDVRIDRC